MKRETVTVVRSVLRDRLDDNAGPDERFDVSRCRIIPRASNEQGRGWIQISGFTVVTPGGADIKASDRILVRGELHSVVGTPGDFGKKGKVVTTERVSSNA